MLNMVRSESEISAPVEDHREPESSDFEIVLGRRQVAGVLFVATVVLVTFASFAYLVGKEATPEAPAAITLSVATPLPPALHAQASPAPVIAKPLPAAPSTAGEPPLFANPVVHATYLQMGAVERGIADVLAEGLRRHGLPAFVAPGPNEKIFRVLIGPLPDQQAYRTVKDKVDAIGLSTFAKTYVN